MYREDGKWYNNLTRFPGVLFDKNVYVIFNNEQSSIHVIREIEIILRKRNLVDKIKKLYNKTCQLCETQVVVG